MLPTFIHYYFPSVPLADHFSCSSCNTLCIQVQLCYTRNWQHQGKNSMTQKVRGAWKIEVTFERRYYCMEWQLYHFKFCSFHPKNERKKMNLLFISSFVAALIDRYEVVLFGLTDTSCFSYRISHCFVLLYIHHLVGVIYLRLIIVE